MKTLETVAIATCGACLFGVTAFAETLVDLNGSWAFRFEEGRPLAEVAHMDFVATDMMTVPACFDAMPRYLRKRGTLVAFNTYPGWFGSEPGSPDDLRTRIREKVDKIVTRFRSRYPEKPIIVSEMGTCGVYGHRDPSAAQWTEEFQAEYFGAVIDTVFANREVCGLTLWQFADAASYYRDGASVRGKPFAENLAGLFDGYRRPKLAVRVIAEKFMSPPCD